MPTSTIGRWLIAEPVAAVDLLFRCMATGAIQPAVRKGKSRFQGETSAAPRHFSGKRVASRHKKVL